MDTLLQDLHHAVRALRRNPGWAVIVVLTLAFGIGANTAVFTFVNGALFQPPRVTRPGERMIYRVSCPVHGVEATIAVRPPRGDEPRHVVRCSLREPPDRIDCAERCLRTATSTA